MSSEIENSTVRIPLRGDRLREIREARRLSQRKLARLCGMNVNQINRYENELVDPQSSILATIAYQLDVSTDYLFGFTDVPQKYSAVDLRSDERRLLEAYTRGDSTAIFRLVTARLDQLEGEGQQAQVEE